MSFKEEKVKEINQFLKQGSYAKKVKAKAEIIDGKIQYSMLTRLDRDPYRTRVDFMKAVSLLDGKDMRYLVKKYGKTPVGGSSPAKGNKAKPKDDPASTKAVAKPRASHEFTFKIELKVEDDIEKSEKTVKAATKDEAAKKVERSIGNRVARYKLVGKDGVQVTGEKWCEIDIALPKEEPVSKGKPKNKKPTGDQPATAPTKPKPANKPMPKASKEVKSSVVFWDVDTQVDFMLPAGKLYVPGAVDLIPTLKKITKFIQKKKLLHYSSLDVHVKGDKEFLTFPEHCVTGTKGVKKIPETVVDEVEDKKHTIKKAEHSPFSEKETMGKIVAEFKASGVKTIIVYGVATDYCVVAAALGFAKRGFKVVVIKDAVAGVDPKTTAKAIVDMKEAGVKFKTFDKIVEMLSPGSKPVETKADKPAKREKKSPEEEEAAFQEAQHAKLVIAKKVKKAKPAATEGPTLEGEMQEPEETIVKAEKPIEKAGKPKAGKPKAEKITFKQFRSRLGNADQEAITTKLAKLSTQNKESITGPEEKPTKLSRNAWITKLKEMGVVLEAKVVKKPSTKAIPSAKATPPATKPKPVAGEGEKPAAEKKLTFMEYVKVVSDEMGRESAIDEAAFKEMSAEDKATFGYDKKRTRSAWDKHMVSITDEASKAFLKVVEENPGMFEEAMKEAVEEQMAELKEHANASVEASGKEYVRDPTQTVPKPGDNIIDYTQEIHRGPFTKKEKTYLDVDGYVVETTFGPNYKKPRKHQPGKEPAALARPRQPKAEGEKAMVKAEPKISPALAKERDETKTKIREIAAAVKGVEQFDYFEETVKHAIDRLDSQTTDGGLQDAINWAVKHDIDRVIERVERSAKADETDAKSRGERIGQPGAVDAKGVYMIERLGQMTREWVEKAKKGEYVQLPTFNNSAARIDREIKAMEPEKPSVHIYITNSPIASDEREQSEKKLTKRRLIDAIVSGGINIVHGDVKVEVNGNLIKTNFQIPKGIFEWYGIEKSTKQAWDDAAKKPEEKGTVVKRKLEEDTGSGAFQF